MAEKVTVAKKSETEAGRITLHEADGRRIALCNVDGAFYAIDDVCTHDGGALDQGELIGKEIECPRHGARFDVTTGRVTRLPAVRGVKTYSVSIDDGAILVAVES